MNELAAPPFTHVESSISMIIRSPSSSGSTMPSADRPTSHPHEWCWMTPETACLSADTHYCRQQNEAKSQ
ncbi:hypothetical protein ACNKHM_09750 [Shigella sonnei]